MWNNHIGRADSVRTGSDEPNLSMMQRKTWPLSWRLLVSLLLNSPSRIPSRCILSAVPHPECKR